MPVLDAVRITAAQKAQFNEQGFFVLENVIPEDHLSLLRGGMRAPDGADRHAGGSGRAAPDDKVFLFRLGRADGRELR